IAGDLPVVLRNGARYLVHPRAERERRRAASRLGDAVRQRHLDSTRMRELDMSLANQTVDRRNRRGERETLQRTHVELPVEERDGESLFEQEFVTQIPVLRREIALLRATQDRQRLIPPAIDDLDKGRPTRAARILRSEEQQVGRKLDVAAAIPRRT